MTATLRFQITSGTSAKSLGCDRREAKAGFICRPLATDLLATTKRWFTCRSIRRRRWSKPLLRSMQSWISKRQRQRALLQ